MSVETGRIGRFVRAARTLLLAQLAAAALALGFAIWAVVAVSDLAAERDQLREQLASRQGDAPPVAAAPLEPQPGPGAAPSAPIVVPIAVPIPETVADTNTILPGDPLLDGEVPPPAAEPAPPEQDCIGASANQTRCRPGRWTRPPTTRPPAETPPANTQQPPSEN